MSEAVWLLVAANKTRHRGTSLVVQGLRIQVPSAGGLGLIRGQETRSHMLELGPGTAKIKIIVKKKKKKRPTSACSQLPSFISSLPSEGHSLVLPLDAILVSCF